MPREPLTWFHKPSPVSVEEIDAVEKSIGHRLPNDYRDFARQFSGGSPNETDFEFADEAVGTFYASVGEFLPINGDCNLVRWMERTEFFPQGLVPFARDGGGNYVCFDYRSSHLPSVIFWHHGRRGMPDEVSFVTKTFTEFVDLLKEPSDQG